MIDREKLIEVQNLSGLGEKFERQLEIQKQFAQKMKLIDLLTESEILCEDCGTHGSSYCIEAIADYLIANGVVISKTETPTTNADRCVCCGAIIPEGQMVCPNCLVTMKDGDTDG